MKPLVTLLLFAMAASAFAQAGVNSFSISPDGIERITVEARHFESGIDGSSMQATGNVRAVILQRAAATGVVSPIIIQADALSADLPGTVLTAEGHVSVETDEREIRGSRVVYNWSERRGRVESVLLEIPGLSFQAETVTVSPGALRMNRVAFGGCGLTKPDYLIRAGTVKLSANRSIVATNAVLEVFGHRLVRLPRLGYKTRTGSGSSNRVIPVPRPRYSQISGLSIAQPVPLTDELTAELELTTRLGLRGLAEYRREGAVAPYLDVDWKQPHSGRNRLTVLMSRLPEAGIKFGEESEGTFNVGYYREHSTGVNEGRAHLSLDHTILDRGESVGLRILVGGRASAYTNGDSYADAHFEASVGQDRPELDVYQELGIRENAIVGNSPFEWDQVPVTLELFAGRRVAWKQYRFEGIVRYDLGHREIFDVNYAVARRFNCLTPEIRYSRRKREISFAMKMKTPGL